MNSSLLPVTVILHFCRSFLFHASEFPPVLLLQNCDKDLFRVIFVAVVLVVEWKFQLPQGLVTVMSQLK
jgi:hypothetical protein